MATGPQLPGSSRPVPAGGALGVPPVPSTLRVGEVDRESGPHLQTESGLCPVEKRNASSAQPSKPHQIT